MEQLLKDLLESLERVGKAHEELYDSDVRQRMSNALMDGFVRAKTGYVLPTDYGMFSGRANALVRGALERYIETASANASECGLVSFHSRLAALQNRRVRTAGERNDYEEFLGHSPPEVFDDLGNVVRTH